MRVRSALLRLLFLLPCLASLELGAISLNESLQKTLQDSPRLAVFPFEQRAHEARVLQAGFRPNPELSVELENLAGNGDYRNTDAAEFTPAPAHWFRRPSTPTRR